MTTAGVLRRTRSPRARRTVATLTPLQIRWLGALLLARARPADPERPDLGCDGGPVADRRAPVAARARSHATRRSHGAHSLVGARRVRDRRDADDPRDVRHAARPRSVGRLHDRPRRHQVPRSAVRARWHAARLPRRIPVDHAVPVRAIADGSARRCSLRCSHSAVRLPPCAQGRNSRSRRRRCDRRSRRPRDLLVQGLPLAAMLFLLFPRLAAPLWGLPQSGRATTGLSETMSPGPHRGADRRTTRSRCARTSRAARRRRHSATGAVRCCRASTAPPGRSSYQRLGGTPTAPPSDAISYMVTLEPSDRPWLLALELPATLAPLRRRHGDRCGRGHARPAAAGQGTDRAGAALHAARRSLSDRYAARPDEVAENLRLPDLRESRARASSPATLRARHRRRPRIHRRDPHALPQGELRLHARARRGPVARSGRWLPVRFAARILRALCERIRRPVARSRHSCAHRHRLPGRRAEPARQLPVVRQSDAHAWVEAIVDGRWQRFDPTGAMSPLRIESGISRALPGADLPLFTRLERWRAQGHAAVRRCAESRLAAPSDRLRSRTPACAAAHAQARSRRALADRERRRACRRRVDGLVLAWLALPAQPQRARRRALERRVHAACARRTAARASRRPDRVQRARERALARLRDRVPRDRRVVCEAALRSARASRARGADRDARAGGGGVACGETCCGSAGLQASGGRYFSGSIGLPSRRISKCSFTWSASVDPISAIFSPRFTCWPSFTTMSRLCAYADRNVLLCLMMTSLP